MRCCPMLVVLMEVWLLNGPSSPRGYIVIQAPSECKQFNTGDIVQISCSSVRQCTSVMMVVLGQVVPSAIFHGDELSSDEKMRRLEA